MSIKTIFATTLVFCLVSLPSYAADLAAGKALSTQCSACHGKDGLSKDPEAPSLAGQSAIYIEKQIMDYKAGRREDRRMSIIAQGLTKDQIKDLAAWYSAFTVTATPPEL